MTSPRSKPASRFFLILLLTLSFPAVLSTYFSFQINTIASGSMRPAIQPGDAIVTIVKEAEALEPGDVVLLFDPRVNVVQAHRITQQAITGDQIELITRGDANSQEDEKAIVFKSTPIRTSIFVLPGFGNILNNISRNSNTILVVALGAILALAVIDRVRKRSTSTSTQTRDINV